MSKLRTEKFPNWDAYSTFIQLNENNIEVITVFQFRDKICLTYKTKKK